MGSCHRVLLVLLLAGSLTFPARAQREPMPLPGPDDASVRFSHLTQEDGLSQYSVFAILQDRHGFMWFGTFDGLNKYDGYRFTVYQHDPNDPNSLSTGDPGHISALLEDRDGMLWIGYEGGGLSRFDPLAETFTHYRHDLDDSTSLSNDRVWALHEDRQGVLWVGTKRGLDRFEPETGTFTRLVPDPERPGVDEVLEDAAGTLWLGTTRGLYRYDPGAEEAGALGSPDQVRGRLSPGQGFTRYRLAPEEQTPVGGNWVTALHEDRQGTLWVGAWGLHRFDRQTGTFERFLMDPSAAEASVWGVNRVWAIVEDHTGALWAAGRNAGRNAGRKEGGLNRFDRETGTFTRYLHDPDDPGSLNSNHVESLYEDRQGILWVGTGDGGVSRVDRTARRFTTYPFDASKPNGLRGGAPRGLFLDRDDVLWVGTIDGVLNRYDRRRGTVTQVTHPEDAFSLSSGGVNAIYRDRRGRLWVGTWGGGLYRLEEATGQFTRYAHDPEDPNSISHNMITTIYEDRAGVLWVGTGGGFNRFNAEDETFTRYVHDPDDATSISSNGVPVIYEDHAGMLWVGLSGGRLDRFDPAEETFTHYLPGLSDSANLAGGPVFGLYERPQEPGVLWIGSFRGGLYRLVVATGRITHHYTSQSSDLPNNTLYCVLGDDQGYLWMSTHQGLVRFDPDEERFEVFSTEDGLQGLEFDVFAYHKGYDGELFFGAVGGVNAIRPEAVLNNPHPPEVALTGLRLFNQPVVPGPDSPLKTSITVTEAMVFSHAQNDLTIEYVGLHFRNPERNQYAYLLEGYDEAWREVGTQRQAVYTNLPPGDYTFRVKAASSDGVWNEAGRSLAITIRPPWWRTGWAYAFYALLFAAGVFAVDRVQRRRLIRRERERARERELEQAREIERAYHELRETKDRLVQQEKLASLGQLTAGIAHEIKNPLNFINNFAELNEEIADELREAVQKGEDLDALIADLKENAQVIAQQGRRADGIVHAMMQHAAGGTGEREATDVNALVSEYVELAYHGKRAQLPGFTVEIERDFDEAAGSVAMVPQEIGRVLLNLLSNAFDAVHEQARGDGAHHPRVRVSTRRLDGQVGIRVADNGPGIPEDSLPKIFEPFFTTKPPGSGTGLGLSLSYEIVTQGHGGRLTVESTEGEGAAFVVSLPASTTGEDGGA